MVFPSLPLHLNPPNNWNQLPQNQQQGAAVIVDERKQPPLAVSERPGPTRPESMAERARLAKIAPPEPALSCPRCDSNNTKFCYYNNYSLTQPRHFCKTCRRYWTRGGALRNVPVGGGCRSNRRAGKSSCFSPTSSPTIHPSKSSPTSVPSANLGSVWEGVTADPLGCDTWPGIQLPPARFSKNIVVPNRSLVVLSAAPPLPILGGASWNQAQEYGYGGQGLEQWRFPYLGETAEAAATAGMYNYREGEWNVGGCINGNGGGGWVSNSSTDHVLGFGSSSSKGNGNT